MEMEIRKREFLAIAIFVLLSSAYYLFMPVFPGLGGDFGEGAVTLFYSLYTSVCEGSIALWNPNIWGGIPVLGQTCFQAVYPVNLLIYSILSHSTFEWFIVIDYIVHFSVLCTGLYFFQRLNKVSVLASFASVLVVASSVEMMRQTMWVYLFTGFVWLPLIIDFIILFEKSKSVKAWMYVLGAGIALGLSGLANQGQTLLINILIVCILYLCYVGTKFSKSIQPPVLPVSSNTALRSFEPASSLAGSPPIPAMMISRPPPALGGDQFSILILLVLLTSTGEPQGPAAPPPHILSSLLLLPTVTSSSPAQLSSFP